MNRFCMTCMSFLGCLAAILFHGGAFPDSEVSCGAVLSPAGQRQSAVSRDSMFLQELYCPVPVWLAFDPRDGMSGRAGRRGVCSGIMMLMAILRYGGNAARFGFCFRNPAVRAAVRAGKQSRSAKEGGTEMV